METLPIGTLMEISDIIETGRIMTITLGYATSTGARSHSQATHALFNMAAPAL